MKTNYINLIIILVFVLIVAIGCGKSDEEKRLDAEKLARPAKFAAARAGFSQKPTKVVLVQQAFLKGKVVVLSSTNGSEFGYTGVFELKNLEAATPEEVGTVVLEECRQMQKGVYRTNENPPREVPAMAIDCRMSLIDRANSTVYFIKDFITEPTKDARISETANSVVNGATPEMNTFLNRLPKK